MTIWANTIVNNEENFIWFAVMSVVDYVDKVLIWDTGSTDRTVEIIKEIKRIKGDKVKFREVGEVDEYQFTSLRQKMLLQSNCDWILILDGDEIWRENSIKKIVKEINTRGSKIEAIVVPTIVPAGDIYHFQEEKAGQYHLLGRIGHYNLRAISKKIPGLHVDWPHPDESYLDQNNEPIQERKATVFLDAPYLHATHLKRSSFPRKHNKFKYELGESFPADFKFPEILLKPYPKIVSSPWIKISGVEKIWAILLTPIRKIKRRLR